MEIQFHFGLNVRGPKLRTDRSFFPRDIFAVDFVNL